MALSDEAILAEIEAIRAWFDAQAASSKDSEELARALGLLAHEFVARHPKAAFSTTAPRPVSSVTPSEVRQASAIALSGLVGAGALMAMPGLPPPVSMPPPVPLSPLPPIGPVAPPIAAPPPPGPVTSPPVAPAPRPAPVPVPPIAAGALAFLAVMLWPRNTIESGEEERRKLEEYERRRRSASNPHPAGPSATTSTASTPTPAPAPGPTPVPPLGTGPNERRLPNQTCENQLLDMLQKAMHDVCDRIPGESCSPKKVSPKKLARRPCSQVRQRIQAVRECMRLRQNIQDQCFGGVADQKHADVLTELQSGLAACLALEAVNCAPGHPMAEL